MDRVMSMGNSDYEVIQSGYDDEIVVSVIVLTYHPTIEKLKYTIDSIINQQGLAFEIVISDDGSENNHFDWLEAYLKEKQVLNYKLIRHFRNQGTVINTYDAVCVASGRFVKPISPGDALYDDNTLTAWVERLMKHNEYLWSFGNAINYIRKENGTLDFVSLKAFPQMVKDYNCEDSRRCRWDYVVLDDQILGAATILQRELFKDYLGKLTHKVIYAEDNIYRILMFDGIVPYYYSGKVVKYEYGSGISTSRSVEWDRKLDKDLEETEKIMLESVGDMDDYQRKMAKAYSIKYKGGRFMRILNRIFRNHGLRFTIKKKINMRMTDCQ